MSLTVVVTRNTPDRFRGFLASVMLEVAPGVYVSPRMSQAVRERVWRVCNEWSSLLPEVDGGLTMLWRDRHSPSGLRIEVIGAPKSEVVEQDGLWLARREPPAVPEATAMGHSKDKARG